MLMQGIEATDIDQSTIINEMCKLFEGGDQHFLMPTIHLTDE